MNVNDEGFDKAVQLLRDWLYILEMEREERRELKRQMKGAQTPISVAEMSAEGHP